MSSRIVQITDLHLFKNTDGLLAGVSTWDTFNAVLEQISVQQQDIDYLILTGDIAHDEELETYLMLREALGEWLTQCRIIPGNHDNPSPLRQAFPELYAPDRDLLTFDFSTGNWHLVGLDSHVPGEVNGRIGERQLEWLKGVLISNSSTQTLLFIHHPPMPISVDWIDQLGLNHATNLIELIRTSPQIKVVCAGHVHQEFSGEIGRAAMYTTPSTCVQFGARAKKSFDHKTAGYRVFELYEDDYHTTIHRLADA